MTIAAFPRSDRHTAPRRSVQRRRSLVLGLLFLSPWIVGFFAFLAFPIAASLYFSFTEFSVLQPPQFIGLANYRELLRDEVFWKALGNTVVYASLALPLGIVVALSLAMLLNTGVPGLAIYRTIFFLPSLVPTVALAILWLWLFNGSYGVLNYFLPGLVRALCWGLWSLPGVALVWLLAQAATARRKPAGQTLLLVGGLAALSAAGWAAGIPNALAAVTPPSWLSDPRWVKPAMVLMSLWGVGHAMVIYLAALQDVPTHLLEAAELDGANPWQRIRHVTLPMLSPVILFNLIMGIIGTFNFFAIPFVMAPGGQPARSAYFLAVNLYDNAYLYLRMGYACAMAWILFVIVFALTMLALRISRGRVHYAE